MITLILGDVGTGKTLFICLLSQLSSRMVYTNFKVMDSNKKVKKFSMKYVLNETINNTDVMIDEFYMYMDARKFMSDINQLLSIFAFQSRKLKLRMYLSTQIVRTIDVRMREMIDNVIECSVFKSITKISAKNPDGIIEFRYTIYTDINSPIYSRPKTLALSYENAYPYFDKYNTYELIKTPQFEALRRNVSANEFTAYEITKISKEAIKFLQSNKLKPTKTNIAVFCIKNDYSTRADFVNKIYADCTIISANSL